MKKFVVALLALGFSTAAFAQAAPDFAAIDADANGGVTFEELSTSFPTVTAEAFQVADADASGALSAEEFAVIVANLPA